MGRRGVYTIWNRYSSMFVHSEFISAIVVHLTILELFTYGYNIVRVTCKSKVNDFKIHIVN